MVLDLDIGSTMIFVVEKFKEILKFHQLTDIVGIPISKQIEE